MNGRREQEATEERPEDERAQAMPAAPENGERPPERGGPKGPEPTRYGDWERSGRCIDF